MIQTDILVIGGGASGLLASLVINDANQQVTIIEGQNRVGKKILTTGNGRCNITNRKIKPPFVNYHSENDHFFSSVLSQFTVDDTINYFNYIGIPIIELDEGKMYPMSLQASSVLDVFLLSLEEREIPIYLNSKVIGIKSNNDRFIVETNNAENKYFQANRILISCGGMANPNTGSDGSIHDVVKNLGHRIIRTLPSIVQLKLEYGNLKAISGVRFYALATITVNDEIMRQEFDEVLFTDYGISGPAILQLSRNASEALEQKKSVDIILDLFSQYTDIELQNEFESRFSLMGNRSIFNALVGVIHKKLIPIILKDSGLMDIHKTCDSLSYQEKLKLYQTLKNWKFKCNGTNGFINAQTTIGGIDTKDVDNNTLESKIIKGLYFSGEILDVDGDCGGYNLQWAWSSGYVAGKNISK